MTIADAQAQAEAELLAAASGPDKPLAEKFLGLIADAKSTREAKTRLDAARDSMRVMENSWAANLAAAETGRKAQARLAAAEAEVKRLNVENDSLREQLKSANQRIVQMSLENDAARELRRSLGMTA